MVISEDNIPLAIGSFSFSSQISVRIWSFDTEVVIDKNYLSNRFNQSLKLRYNLFDLNKTNAFRIINSESDFFPGLIVDYYVGYYVVQFLSAGVEFFRDIIVDIISEQNDCIGIYERSDTDSRKKENLSIENKILFGDNIPDKILFKENDIYFYSDIVNGHKTGFYLDQRDNRFLIQEFSKGKNILNCFSYTGGFSVYALKAGANFVTNIDTSANSLNLLVDNHNINNIQQDKYLNIEGDVFKILRDFRDEGKKFDLIILDPPKFAESATNIKKAAKGYKDINLLAIRLLNPGGILFTFSCSGHISRELFHKIIHDASIDANKEVRFLSILNQAKDHPVLSSFPESFYLKGLVCSII